MPVHMKQYRQSQSKRSPRRPSAQVELCGSSTIHPGRAARAPWTLALLRPLRLCAPLLVLAAACSDEPAAPLKDAAHPRAKSVVLFTVDTLRADRLSPYGDKGPATPNAARLAAESMLFERAFSQGSNTNPAVSSFLTGLTPPRHGVIHQTAKMDSSVVTLPMMLEVAGVRSGSFVANLCKLQNVPNSVFNEGWEERFCGMDKGDEQWQWDGAVVDAAMEWIADAAARDEPFFAWVHLMDPHSEHRPPETHWDYEAKPVLPRLKNMKHYSSFEENREAPPEDVLQELLDLYSAEVAGADDQLGRMLDFLDELPGSDDMALIFSADHGEELYETWPRIGHGLSLTEGVLWVPLMVRAPGLAPGRYEEPVETLAITPTILGLFGLEPPYNLDGNSVFSSRQSGFARTFESKLAISLRTRNHRYWFRTTPKPWVRKEAPWRGEARWFQELENLAEYDDSDPTTPNWLDPSAAEHEELHAEFKLLLNDAYRMVKEGPPTEEIEDPEYAAQLENLGYLDNEGPDE